MSENKNVIGGAAKARADVSQAAIDTKPVRGAIVEDTEVAGTVSGGVQTKATDGKIHEGHATDRREQG